MKPEINRILARQARCRSPARQTPSNFCLISHFFHPTQLLRRQEQPLSISTRATTMSPPPSKGSKGKTIYARRCGIFCIVGGVVSSRRGCSSSRFLSKCSIRYANIALPCLCLFSRKTCSHHLRLGRYHLPLVVRRSIQGR